MSPNLIGLGPVRQASDGRGKAMDLSHWAAKRIKGWPGGSVSFRGRRAAPVRLPCRRSRKAAYSLRLIRPIRVTARNLVRYRG
jgi:hypothetical protein